MPVLLSKVASARHRPLEGEVYEEPEFKDESEQNFEQNQQLQSLYSSYAGESTAGLSEASEELDAAMNTASPSHKSSDHNLTGR